MIKFLLGTVFDVLVIYMSIVQYQAGHRLVSAALIYTVFKLEWPWKKEG